MNAEVKEIGPCKMSVNIEVPQDKVKSKLDEKFKNFMEGTIVPGFRKGHAPMAVIERKFGKELKEEVKYDIIGESCDEVFKDKKLEVLGEPAIEFDKITLDEAKPLKFEVTVEVAPTINLKDYKGIEVKKPKVEVTKDEIDKFMEEMRTHNAEMVVVEKEAAKEGDYLVADNEVTVEGKSLAKQENMSIPLGAQVGFFGKEAPELKKALIGAKPGEAKELTLTVPDNYKDAQYRNKPANIKITIKEIKRPKLPELSDKWAKDIGFESLAQMKEETKKRLTARKETESEEQTEAAIMDKILAQTDFPLPESVVNRANEQLVARRAMEMYYYRLPEDKIREEVEKFKATSKDIAVKNIKTEFISEHIAKQEKIFVTEDEVKERINKVAASSKRLPAEVRKEYESKGWLSELRAEMKEEKVRKFLKEHAKITE